METPVFTGGLSERGRRGEDAFPLLHCHSQDEGLQSFGCVDIVGKSRMNERRRRGQEVPAE
jgi:hypothetical protein